MKIIKDIFSILGVLILCLFCLWIEVMGGGANNNPDRHMWPRRY